MRALNHWLGKSRDGREFKMYSLALKQQVRRLARSGVLKTEIPNILKVSYPAVVRWTSDIKQDKSRVSGTYFRLLSELVNKGFVIMDRKDIWLYHLLKKHVKVKSVVFGKVLIILVPGKERTTEQAFIDTINKDKLSKRKLNNIRYLFMRERTNGFNY
jgi:hypothetical protein